jgi:cbb3-type cytochrome oxidase maturation protein
MRVLTDLVPLTLLLGLTGVVAFLWSLKSSQYGNPDGAPLSVLPGDSIASR